MIKTIHVVLFACILFFQPNLTNYLGVDIRLVTSFFLAIGIYLIIKSHKKIISNRIVFIWLIFCILYGLFKLYTDKGEGTRFFVLQMISTPVLFCSFPKIKTEIVSNNVYLKRRLTLMMKLFFSFYLLETFIAILERVMGYSVLGWSGVSYSIGEKGIVGFRSTALCGHPLYNALVVSVSMAFILFSSLKYKYKFALWGLGYVSILCFNTRSSIVGNSFCFFFYVLYEVFYSQKASLSTKIRLLCLVLLFFVFAIYLVISQGLGGRLLEMGLFDDDSAQVRVDVWRLFDYISWSDIITGMSFSKIDFLIFRAGLIATENFWIDQLFFFGVVFMVPYVILYYKVIKRLLVEYSLIHKLYVIGVFLLIASTNNSLSTNYFALYLFLMLCVLFTPTCFCRILPSKYCVKI